MTNEYIFINNNIVPVKKRQITTKFIGSNQNKRIIGIIIGLGGAAMFLLILMASLLSGVSEPTTQTDGNLKVSATSEGQAQRDKSVEEGFSLPSSVGDSSGKPEILKVWESPHTRVKFRKNTNPSTIESGQEEPELEPEPEYQNPDSEDVHY